MYGAGRSRIAEPFATLTQAETRDPFRLACVKHAASVHPEAESNPPQKTLRKESEKQTLKNKKDENILKEGHSHKTPPQFNPTKGTHQKAGLQRTGNH